MTETRVNFLFLGGAKCGSTWLDFILRQHPDVCLATNKELFFFDLYYSRGLKWYDAQFPPQNARRTGEICHDYLYSNTALERIGKTLPADARCLICLRNPVDRTLSHYQYLRKIGTTNAPLAQALTEHPNLLNHSCYAPHLEQAIKHIGRDRLHVVWFDDLAGDPAAYYAEICDALDIRFLSDLPYDTQILPAASSRSPQLTRTLRNTGWLLRRIRGQKLVSAVKSNPTVQRLLYTSKKSKTPIDRDALRPHLERFHNDKEALANLLGTAPPWTIEL
ncbi:sulfotransferase (plasmid) [Falsihalocynthiibacter sp. SS001]|uniref:sulfotransferase family protein n=1 Tax=Falsihalocynthiibacter sp. SS001 TaxID=3349698 RepID=UPI0036D27324